jgi:hypothetical protein
MTQVTDPSTGGIGFATAAQQYLAHMVADRIVSKAKGLTTKMRAAADEQLLDRFNNPGVEGRQKSIEVLHDGVHIGTVTVVEPKGSFYVADEGDLIEHLEETNPGALEVKVTVRGNVLKTMTDPKNVAVAEDGTVYNKNTGETIPGLAYKAAGPATTTRFTPFTGAGAQEKRDARDEVLDQLAADFDIDALVAAADRQLEAHATIEGTVVAHQGEESAA